MRSLVYFFPNDLSFVRAAYTTGYNLTVDEDEFLGTIEGNGKVIGFEELDIDIGKRYLCAKVSISERDELSRLDDNMTTVSSKLLMGILGCRAGQGRERNKLLHRRAAGSGGDASPHA